MRIAIVGPFTGASLGVHFPALAVAGDLPPGYPGAPLMAVLAKGMADRGHHVAAITTDYTTPVEELDPFKVYRAQRMSAYFCPQRRHSFRNNSNGMRGRAFDFFQYERRCLISAINDFKPDVVHAHWTYEFVWAALDSQYPTLATAHDSPLTVLRFMPNLYRAFRYAMARQVISRCTHLTAVSTDLEAKIRRYAKTRISVVPNPIAADVMSAAGCSPDAFASKTILTVLNGWNSLKNGDLALRAFKLARESDPSLRLVCFGADWQPGGLAHQWARKNGADANVAFRGPVPQQTILEQMRASTALLHPSRREACSMVIAEAMSVGLPVIAGRHTDGVAWQLDNGRAGVLADITKVADVARGVVAVANDPLQWKEMSTAARSRAKQLFSVDAVVDRYLSLYPAAAGAKSLASLACSTP